MTKHNFGPFTMSLAEDCSVKDAEDSPIFVSGTIRCNNDLVEYLYSVEDKQHLSPEDYGYDTDKSVSAYDYSRSGRRKLKQVGATHTSFSAIPSNTNLNVSYDKIDGYKARIVATVDGDMCFTEVAFKHINQKPGILQNTGYQVSKQTQAVLLAMFKTIHF